MEKNKIQKHTGLLFELKIGLNKENSIVKAFGITSFPTWIILDEKGKVYNNNEIKNYLAKEYKHFNAQIIDLDKKFLISNEKNNYD